MTCFIIIYLVIGFLFGLCGFMMLSKHGFKPTWAKIAVGIIEMFIWPFIIVSGVIDGIVRK